MQAQAIGSQAWGMKYGCKCLPQSLQQQQTCRLTSKYPCLIPFAYIRLAILLLNECEPGIPAASTTPIAVSNLWPLFWGGTKSKNIFPWGLLKCHIFLFVLSKWRVWLYWCIFSMLLCRSQWQVVAKALVQQDISRVASFICKWQ